MLTTKTRNCSVVQIIFWILMRLVKIIYNFDQHHWSTIFSPNIYQAIKFLWKSLENFKCDKSNLEYTLKNLWRVIGKFFVKVKRNSWLQNMRYNEVMENRLFSQRLNFCLTWHLLTDVVDFISGNYKSF